MRVLFGRSLTAMACAAAITAPLGCKHGVQKLPAPTPRAAAAATPAAQDAHVATVVQTLLHTAAAQIANAQDADGTFSAIAALGPAAVAPAAAALHDPDDNLRLAAVQALQKIGSGLAVDPLIAALHDGTPLVRLQVVQALGALHDRRAVQPLLHRLKIDDSPQVRYECLTSLGLIGDPAALPILLAGTHDHDPYVRMWAMDALCQMKVQQAPALAIELLRDANVYVPRQVMLSCKRTLDTPAGHQALIDLILSSKDFKTTFMAQRSLMGYLREPSNAAQLTAAIRQAGRAAVARSHGVNAALLLGTIKDPAAVDGLLAALKDPVDGVRAQAAYDLGRIGERRAVPALSKALGDKNRIVAAWAYNSLQWFATGGDRSAQLAVESYKGNKFARTVPRS